MTDIPTGLRTVGSAAIARIRYYSCVKRLTSSLVVFTLLLLAVSIDDDGDGYHRFWKEHKVDLLTVRDSAKKAPALYGTFKWPETYVIDRSGVVRRKFIGAVDWNSREVDDFLTHL